MWQTEGGERSNERGSEQRVDRLNRSTQIRTFVLLPANQIEHWLSHVWLCRETKKNPTEKKELFIHWIAESNLKFSIKCASTFLSLKSAHEWIWALPLWNAKSCVLSAFQALFRFGIAHFYVSFDLFTTRFFPPSLVLSLAFCLFEMFVQCSLFFFGSLPLQFEMVAWIKEWGWLKWKSNKISVHFYFRFHSFHPPTVLPPSPLCIATKEMMIWMSTSFLVDIIFLMVCSLNWNYYSFCCDCSLVFFYSPHFAMITCNFRSWFFVALHS